MLPAAHPDDINRYRAQGWWSETTLSQRVAELAKNHPTQSAYIWGDTQITWHGYSALADSIAHRLAGERVAQGDRALVWLPDGGAIHAAFLGCERAGVVAVGAGWRAGVRELKYLAQRTNATVLIVADETFAGSAREICALLDIQRVIVMHDLDGHPTVSGGALAPTGGSGIAAHELWLLNSTSGTTGLPKCVMQTQNRWEYFHHKAVEFGALHDVEVWMSVVPAPFGFGLWTSHVSPTLLGVPCVVSPRFSASQTVADIERHGVTVLAAVSSQFVMIMNAAADRDLSSLRVLFTGGEAISPARAREFEDRFGCMVLNFYGSNETGLLSGTRVTDAVEARFTTGGCVVPEMNVRLYDEFGNRIPGDRGRGRPACKGPATTLGYWDDVSANAELFTQDGWMFMGDIVDIDTDGWLSVVARTADFIIRGGKNISAPAVEDEVASHPAVCLAAAVPVPDERLGELVGVFVELLPGAALDLEQLVTYLRDRGVSREWWPERLWVVAELPRSSGGKVAKGELRALVLPGSDADVAGEAVVSPNN